MATYDDHQHYALNTLVVITLRQNVPIALKYLLALINSRVLNFYYVSYLKSTKRIFSEIQARQLAQLPIKLPANRNSNLVQPIVSAANSMLELNDRLKSARNSHDRAALERQIRAVDAELDVLVYQLYSLTPEEIAIVEGREQATAAAQEGILAD